MKKSKQLQLKYETMQKQRLELVSEQILADSLTNALLHNVVYLPDYFKYWIEGARLVAVLPTLEAGHEKKQSYYSVDSLQGNARFSPVFMYHNEEFEDITKNEKSATRFFLFDSEFSRLYSYEKKPHSPECHFVKKEDFEAQKTYFMAHPVILFFMGCDDGHVGRRFKTQTEAMEYLQLLDVFEDIFEDKLENHN